MQLRRCMCVLVCVCACVCVCERERERQVCAYEAASSEGVCMCDRMSKPLRQKEQAQKGKRPLLHLDGFQAAITANN